MFKIILLGIISNSFFSIQASMTREHLIFSKLGYRMTTLVIGADETITHYASLLIYRYFWSRSMHFQFYSYIMQYIENNIIKYVEYIRLLLNRQKLNLKTFSACGQGCGLDPKKCQSGSKTHGRLLRLQQQKLFLKNSGPRVVILYGMNKDSRINVVHNYFPICIVYF